MKLAYLAVIPVAIALLTLKVTQVLILIVGVTLAVAVLIVGATLLDERESEDWGRGE